MPKTAEQIVISLFDYTGNMIAPWAEAGFRCYSVDLQHMPGEWTEGNIIRVGADGSRSFKEVPYTTGRMAHQGMGATEKAW
jgi:hypothetical protein